MTYIRGKPKHKKRNRYIDYDYEEAYQKNAYDLTESEIDKMLKQGKIKSIYATKTIAAGNQFEVEVYPEFTRKKDIPSYTKRNDKAQKKLNNKNARKHFIRVINTNFEKGYAITFTYTDDNLPATMEDARKDMQNYVKKINRRRKKRGLDNMKYVYVTEWNQNKKIRCHHHLICDDDLSMDELECAWTKGKRNKVERLDYDENGLNGLGDYLTKDPAGKKRWCSSNNLKKPIERKNHQTFKQKHVRDMVKDNNQIQHYMETKYPDYQFVDANIYYNDYNARYYIYAKMRKKGPPIHDQR